MMLGPMSELSRHELAASFGAAADAYERGRPGYPEAALDWLLPGTAETVLDLGAGTGKLTRLLRARGLTTYAVEPSAAMLDQLRAAVPGALVRPGSAEEIPLPDVSVDAVLVAQAWHWMDPSHAGPEVARVLRPGGRLGLLWNLRDDREPWVAALSRIMGGPDWAVEDTVLDPRLFHPLERTEVGWTHTSTRAGVLDMVASRSYLITASPTSQQAVLDQVRKLLDSHPAVAGSDSVTLPYRTVCRRARRR